MKEMKNKTFKHRNCIIVSTPSEKFPELVTITKTPKIRKDFEGRRYLSLKKCFIQIELFESERLINSKESYVQAQLEDVVVLSALR